ncbi:MAG: PIN domain-containing protein [Leptolyngbyaceae cyanobacterium SU_3_3]|nr:PIN domain-containing protein [Leptolyngbyaceae cyanobacterium SU_3_3]
MTHSVILVDTGVLVSLYDKADCYHDQVIEFLRAYRGRLITTLGCVTEVMWLLASDYRVQNEFLRHLSEQIYECETLQKADFLRIAELNQQYSDLPADFSDLALVAVSERLNIPGIATLDKDFDVYRRYRSQPFERVFYPR